MNKIVIFEGIDRSGKDTAQLAFQEYTGYMVPTINRFLGSHWVYGIHKRKMTREEVKVFIDMEKLLTPDNYFQVYLYAPESTIKDRMRDTGETDIEAEDVNEIQYLYWEWLKLTTIDTISIDTSRYSPEGIAEEIWKNLSGIT